MRVGTDFGSVGGWKMRTGTDFESVDGFWDCWEL